MSIKTRQIKPHTAAIGVGRVSVLIPLTSVSLSSEIKVLKGFTLIFLTHREKKHLKVNPQMWKCY